MKQIKQPTDENSYNKPLILFKFSLKIYVLFFCINNIFSQNVGINSTGATPNSSAMLDIDSQDKGLLVPRVALVAINSSTPVISPATSLMVYNTASSGSGSIAVSPGYYYWNGSIWIRLINSGPGTGSAWQLDGNSGTTPGNDFLGTTDNKDLVIKTNNTEKVRILSGGNLGVGNVIPSEKLDVTGNIKFSGALMPNNNSGSSGQVLTSNGTNTPPIWTTPTSIIKAKCTFYDDTMAIWSPGVGVSPSGFTYSTIGSWGAKVGTTITPVSNLNITSIKKLYSGIYKISFAPGTFTNNNYSVFVHADDGLQVCGDDKWNLVNVPYITKSGSSLYIICARENETLVTRSGISYYITKTPNFCYVVVSYPNTYWDPAFISFQAMN